MDLLLRLSPFSVIHPPRRPHRRTSPPPPAPATTSARRTENEARQFVAVDQGADAARAPSPVRSRPAAADLRHRGGTPRPRLLPGQGAGVPLPPLPRQAAGVRVPRRGRRRGDGRRPNAQEGREAGTIPVTRVGRNRLAASPSDRALRGGARGEKRASPAAPSESLRRTTRPPHRRPPFSLASSAGPPGQERS